MSEVDQSKLSQAPSDGIVLLGMKSGRPHAARFLPGEAELAAKAARLMSLHLVVLDSPEKTTAAEGISRGKIFASGKSFCPYTKQSIFNRLASISGIDIHSEIVPPDQPTDVPEPRQRSDIEVGQQHASASDIPAEESTTAASELVQADRDPAAIRVGSLVLASEEGAPETWWTATVVAELDANCFELRWGGEWRDEATFTRRRDHLAVLPPALAGKLRQNKP